MPKNVLEHDHKIPLVGIYAQLVNCDLQFPEDKESINWQELMQYLNFKCKDTMPMHIKIGPMS